MANDENNNHDHDLNHDDHDDDHDYQEEERSGVGGSRWNPTKEQIEMLERMYSHEGVRTPSADQIQQITARLRVYGHIEGKNVFYWFQNHKARQRQKQRLERLSAAHAHAHHAHANSSANHSLNHINRFIAPHYLSNNPTANCGVSLNPTRPVFPASHPAYHQHHFLPNPNAVICNPYYQLPQTNLGYYNPSQNPYSTPAANHDHQGMIINNRSSNNPNISKNRVGVPHGSTLSGYCAAMMKSTSSSSVVDHHLHHHHHDDYNQRMRTLNLFPVHPTGILEHKIGSTNNSAANSSCATTSSSSDTNMNDVGDHHQQHPNFIDFFSSGHASSEST